MWVGSIGLDGEIATRKQPVKERKSVYWKGSVKASQIMINLWRWFLVLNPQELVKSGHEEPDAPVQGHKHRWAPAVALYCMASGCYMQMKTTGLIMHPVNQQALEGLSKHFPRSPWHITASLTTLGEHSTEGDPTGDVLPAAFSAWWLWTSMWGCKWTMWVHKCAVVSAVKSNSLILLLITA